MNPSRGRDISRLEAFSDSVIGLAAALLLLWIRIPRTYAELVSALYNFIPFAISFAALIIIWVMHRNVFRRYKLDDTFTIVVNAILLFTVLVFVYPLKFMSTAAVAVATGRLDVQFGSFDDLAHLFTIFSIGWIVAYTCFGLMYQRAYWRREELQLTPLESHDALTHAIRSFAFAVVGLLSAVLSEAGIGVTRGLPVLFYIPALVVVAWLVARTRSSQRKTLAGQISEHPQLAYTGAIRTEDIQHLIR